MTENDPKEIVAKAIEILNAKKVGKNIDHLLNDYLVSGTKVQIQNSAPVPENISSEFKLKDCKKSLLLIYGDKSIQIIVANLRRSMAPDDTGDYGDVILLSQGDCVLKNSVSRDYTEWGSDFRVSFYAFSIDKLKLGAWIDDLALMIKALDEDKNEREHRRKDEQVRKAASNIDLGDYASFKADPQNK